MVLISCCKYCDSRKNLTLCTSCKVTPYCSGSHQEADKPNHEPLCKEVWKYTNDHQCLQGEWPICPGQGHLTYYEKRIRNSPAGSAIGKGPFEDHVDLFWKSEGTYDYIGGRVGLMQTLCQINTYEAIQSAAEHAKGILRLTRSDSLSTWAFYPACLLRLGRDQEAYDTLKWYATVDPRSSILSWTSDNPDRNSPTLPFLDIEGADAFESVEYMDLAALDLCRLVNMALLKFRILLDLDRLVSTHVLEEITPALPVEVVQMIRYHVASHGIVRQRIHAMSTPSIVVFRKQLIAQSYALFMDVDRANNHFWPGLTGPRKYFEDITSEHIAAGCEAEALVELPFVREAWKETPGAISLVKRMSEERGSSLRVACLGLSQDAFATTSEH